MREVQTTLGDCQAAARAALDASPVGHLKMTPRERLWTALGPYDPVRSGRRGSPIISAAHRARATLVLECVRSALPDYDVADTAGLLHPQDAPAGVVAHVDDWLAGRVSAEEMSAERERLANMSQNLGILEEQHPVVVAIAQAAVTMCLAATHDYTEEDPNEFDDERNDDDEQDDDAWTTEFEIAFVRAGLTLPRDADPDGTAKAARTAFWRWYIDELYPQCWAIAYPAAD